MRSGAKRILSLAAAYAVALHAALWVAAAPFAPASAVDPFTIICHSDASAPAEQAPANGPMVPGHACDHCNLCSAVAPPTTPDTAVLGQLAPAELLLVLRPVSLAGRDGIAISPHLARGPPSFA